MLLQNAFSAIKIATVLLLVLVVASPAIAAGKNNFQGDEPIAIDNEESGTDQTLDQNFSPEDRARLRKALADYAKNTDPEHVQIENKRKLMKESIEARFINCDADADDSLDREEATECLPQVARHFSYVDVDENDVITLEELELAQAKSIERQKAAEAKIEARKIQEAEAEIKNKSKLKANKQATNLRKHPS